VGYLDDGTMVVVEDGLGRVGEQVEAVAVSSVNTSAGRLIFARLVDDPRDEQGVDEDEHSDGTVGGDTGGNAAGPRGPTPGVRPRRPASPRNPRR
jgi:hypothetical protein